MIISIVYRVTRALLSVPAVSLRRDVAKGAEPLALRREDAVPAGSLARFATSPRTGSGRPRRRR
jgi:hypothetical protein